MNNRIEISEALADSFRVCVQDICNSITSGALNPGPPISQKIWEQNSDGQFRPRIETQSPVLLKDLETRSSFQECLRLAKSDPIVGPQLGQLVGTEVGRSIVDAEQIIRSLVWGIWSENQAFEFEETGFRKEWTKIAHLLTADTFDYVTVGLLPGFIASFPTEISPTIVIDRLTNDEVTRGIRTGILQTPIPGFEIIEGSQAVGVRCSQPLPKKVGESARAPETGRFGQRGPLDSTSTVSDVIAALRLFKPDRVVSPGEFSTCKAWLLNGGIRYQHRANNPRIGCNYQLAESEFEAFKVLWRNTRGMRF